jgi:hypothetical protein
VTPSATGSPRCCRRRADCGPSSPVTSWPSPHRDRAAHCTHTRHTSHARHTHTHTRAHSRARLLQVRTRRRRRRRRVGHVELLCRDRSMPANSIDAVMITNKPPRPRSHTNSTLASENVSLTSESTTPNLRSAMSALRSDRAASAIDGARSRRNATRDHDGMRHAIIHDCTYAYRATIRAQASSSPCDSTTRSPATTLLPDCNKRRLAGCATHKHAAAAPVERVQQQPIAVTLRRRVTRDNTNHLSRATLVNPVCTRSRARYRRDVAIG